MNRLKVQKTTYSVDSINEPCFIVSNADDSAQVRIATCYHSIGSNTLYLTEFLDGDFNNSEEWTGDFYTLSKDMAIELAKKFSIYLN